MKKSLAEDVLTLIGLFAFLPIAAIWRGYVLSILWRWFVVAWLGAPLLSVRTAIGVGLLLTMFSPDSKRKKEDGVDWTRLFYHVLLYPAIVLGLAWIVKNV